MKDITKTLLFWSPRLLTIGMALFLTVFAMDAFKEKASFLPQIKDFLLHLIPTFLLIFLLSLAWRWEGLGAISFFSLAIWYLTTSWGRFPLSVYALIALPLFIIALLFLVNWFYHDQLKNRFSF